MTATNKNLVSHPITNDYTSTEQERQQKAARALYIMWKYGEIQPRIVRLIDEDGNVHERVIYSKPKPKKENES